MLTWTSSNLAPHPLESRSSARRPRNMPVKRSLGPKSSESFHAGWEPGTAVQAPSGARKEKRIWSSFSSHRSSMGPSGAGMGPDLSVLPTARCTRRRWRPFCCPTSVATRSSHHGHTKRSAPRITDGAGFGIHRYPHRRVMLGDAVKSSTARRPRPARGLKLQASGRLTGRRRGSAQCATSTSGVVSVTSRSPRAMTTLSRCRLSSAPPAGLMPRRPRADWKELRRQGPAVCAG